MGKLPSFDGSPDIDYHRVGLTCYKRIPMDDPVAIDNAIERWHTGEGKSLTLYEYLGWTWDEYAAWVKSDK